VSSAFGDRVVAIGSPLGLRFNGESILRYAGGPKGAASNATAIVTWHPEADANGRDRATRRTGELLLAESSTVSYSDLFKIDGDLVSVTKIGPDKNGFKTVDVTIYNPQTKGGAPLRTGGL